MDRQTYWETKLAWVITVLALALSGWWIGNVRDAHQRAEQQQEQCRSDGGFVHHVGVSYEAWVCVAVDGQILVQERNR